MNTPVALAYDALGQGPALVVLHGFLGAGENWRTVLKPYQDRFTIYYVDLRNHGRSPHQAPHTYAAMADDVRHLLDKEGLATATLLGHSMGGKVAALFALTYPTRTERLLVVDMPLGPNAHRHQDILDAMQQLADTPIANRNEAAAYLENKGIDPDTTQFLLKSYARQPDGSYRWRVNLPLLAATYTHILEPLDHLPATYEGPTAFIRGGASDYVSDADFADAQRLFPNAVLFTVPGAGHWVHATHPHGFQQAFEQFVFAR